MLRIDDNKYFSKPLIYSFWLLMSFQAGYVNVGGFFTSGSFVSHVTGTSSRIGMGLAEFNLYVLMTFVTILLSFIGGSTFAGHYIGRAKEEGSSPRYTFVLLVKALFFALVLFISIFNSKGDFSNLLILFLLSFCSGVQNATCALATNGLLKPTHMTGLSTDIGIFMTKVFAWRSDKEKFREEIKKNLLRISILFGFIIGGVISALVFRYKGHYGFLFPFISSICFLGMGLLRDYKINSKNSVVFKIFQNSVFITALATFFVAIKSIGN